MRVSGASKPLIIGEANPYGGDTYYALYPQPSGCAGWRLCHKILQMTEDQYLETFDRRNLCPRDWDTADARAEALVLLRSTYTAHYKLILFGSKVSRAFGLSFMPLTRHEVNSKTLLVLPHPSGRCPLWNQIPDAMKIAREMIQELL